jgi:hypothetical protein
VTTTLDGLAAPELQRAITELLNSSDSATGDVKAFLLRGQASKMLIDAGTLLDQADAVELCADLAKAAAAADDALRAAEGEASQNADAAKQAVTVEREAADRYAEAAEFARQAREHADDLAIAEAEPAKQTEAIIRRDAADQVAARFRVSAEKATAARLTLDAISETSRGVVRQAKARLKAATGAAQNPPPVEPSFWTCQLDGIRRVAAGKDLGRGGMAEVSQLVENLAVVLGVDRIFAARERQRLETAAKQQRSAQLLPPPGAKRPSGVIISPPGSPPIAPLIPLGSIR